MKRKIRLCKQTKDYKVLKTVSLSLLGTILVRAVNLISIPVFSRLLTTSEYGKVDIFMTYVNIFMIILGLDFAATVGKGRLDFKDEEADKYITSSLVFTTLFSIVVILFINIFFPIFQFVFGMDRITVNIMLLYSYAMFVIAYRSAEYNFYYEYKKNITMSLMS